MPQHWDVHTQAIGSTAADHLAWPVASDAPLSASVEGLRSLLQRKGGDYATTATKEEFMRTFCVLQARKKDEHGNEWEADPDARPMPWGEIVTDSELERPAVLLRQQTQADTQYLEAIAAGEMPPAIPPKTAEAAADTADIPRHNFVQVSGMLPMQHLTVGQLSWRAKAQKPSTGLHTRPVTTATMCPSCGRAFAMHIPEDVLKKNQLTNPDMEQRLGNALEAQRVVLDSEKQLLTQEASDLRSALSAINASLSRAREDEETLAQLHQQQRAWIRWLEQEIRQAKAEIAQVAGEFERCLQSNVQLEGLVEQAISRRMETKYWGAPAQRRGAAVAPPAEESPQRRLGAPQQAAPQGGAGPLAIAAPPGVSRRERLRELVRGFYQRHNPAKLPLVDTLVDEYTGRERELLSLMAQKYGDASVLAHDPVIDGPSRVSQSPQPSSSSDWSLHSTDRTGLPRRREARDGPLPLRRLVADDRRDKRLGELLQSILAAPADSRAAISPTRGPPRAAPPPPLPDLPVVRSPDVQPDRYSHLHPRERDLLQHFNTFVQSQVQPAGPDQRYGSVAQPLPWGSPTHAGAGPAARGAPPLPCAARGDLGRQWSPQDKSTGPTSSSEHSRVTFDLRPQVVGPSSPTLREELMRVAPNTLARRQLGAVR
eukprot:TRINITY_DN23965_c0_g1_i1.p1 TRINITY_DN23965_c0_g1~~TRINITY_DN23965_c0_g1_i1.p1  ORF type:complete len:655 (+),score=202.64 TRINITY_DN23965_c0_g1_i1:83-2047(+)